MVGASSRGARALLALLTLCWSSHASPQVGYGIVPIDTKSDATATMLPSNSSGESLHNACIVSQFRVKVKHGPVPRPRLAFHPLQLMQFCMHAITSSNLR